MAFLIKDKRFRSEIKTKCIAQFLGLFSMKPESFHALDTLKVEKEIDFRYYLLRV